MPNPFPLLNQHIRALARRELKGIITATRKRAAEQRRDIAALKREVRQLHSEVATLRRSAPKTRPTVPVVALDKARFRADGLKTHRAKLGISAKNYGRLVGVSELTIYSWENGKSRPRKTQLAKLLGVRGIGKREALQRLSTKA